jgi:hypothetical protein
VGFVFLVPVVAGFVSLRHARGLPVALAVAGPAAAAVAASLLGIYPLAPRLSLFIAPALILLAAEGIRILAAALSARAPVADRIWFLLMATAALAVAVRTDFKEWRVIHRREDTRPLVEILEERNTQGEPVYVFGRAGTAWLFYTTDWNAPDLARIRGWSALLSSSGLAFRNAPTRGHRVRDEGLDLAFPYRGRVELLGIPTGQGPDSGVRSRATPDPGWAENEARRIRAASDSAAWVFLASFLPASRDALAGAISSLGGREVLRLERTHALLLRYQFPRDTVAASRPSGSR